MGVVGDPLPAFKYGSTKATYQGHPCRDVMVKNSRGLTADTSYVEFFAADFPDSFEFVTPLPGELAPDGDKSHPKPPENPNRLHFEGDLYLEETDAAGNKFPWGPFKFFCVKVQVVRKNTEGRPDIVRAHLVDDRYFNSLGYIKRWSFNRKDGMNIDNKDSLKADGTRFTIGEVARDWIAPFMFRSPRLSTYPGAWDFQTPEIDLPRGQPPAAALHDIGTEFGVNEFVRNLDGSIAVYEVGTTLPGDPPQPAYNTQGSAGNDAQIPPQYVLHLDGTGESQGVEAVFPPDYCVVWGRETIGTITMDGLEPVLDIDGTILPLTEETIAALTSRDVSGKPLTPKNLDWLNSFVLAEPAWRNVDTGINPRIVDILAKQAYRLWRVPGVEVKRVIDDGERPIVPPVAPNELQQFQVAGQTVNLIPQDWRSILNLSKFIYVPAWKVTLRGGGEVIVPKDTNALRVGNAGAQIKGQGADVVDIGSDIQIRLSDGSAVKNQSAVVSVTPANYLGVPVANDSGTGASIAAGGNAPPLDFQGEIRALRIDANGKEIYEKGPNYHLLPILDRAEVAAGKRLKPLVYAPHFRVYHKRNRNDITEAGSKVAEANKLIAKIKNDITALAHKKAIRDPFVAAKTEFGVRQYYLSISDLYAQSGLSAAGVSNAEFKKFINYHRLLDRIREVSPPLAEQYETALRQKAQLQTDLNGSPDAALFALAKRYVQQETTLRSVKSADKLLSPAETNLQFQFNKVKELFATIAQQSVREIKKTRDDFVNREASGTQPRDKFITVQVFENIARIPDISARVYNATAGVFETSKLSGHLKDPKVHNLGRTKFVPMSPAVMFGAYFRPRADKTVSVVGATRVGGTASNKAVVPAWPEGLSDQKTFFKAAFKRVPNARPVAVPYEDVPPGAAVAVNSQLQLLLPATGPGNAYEIVRQAEILAYGAIGKKHVRIPSQTFVVARPWPVNCDGVVASATIKMRDGQAGFTTTIETGDEPIEVVRPYQTRQRRRRGDAAKREGLTD